MQLDNIVEGLITTSLAASDCRLLALACAHAAATCRGGTPAAGGPYSLPDNDAGLAQLYETLGGVFEAAGLAAWAQGNLSAKDEIRGSLASFLAGELDD